MNHAPTSPGAAGGERSVAPPDRVPGSGISALDDRVSGIGRGGVHVLAGPPGPAKLVAALQFVHAGVTAGQRALLLSNAAADDLLEVARGWGLDLRPAFERGSLTLLGFRDDFEMRVLRSAEPEDALEELSGLAPADVHRIAVDPGGLFIQGGARTLLGRAFVEWARRHPASVLVTLAIDGLDLPSSAEWLTQTTDGVLLLDHGHDGIYHVDLRHTRASGDARDQLTLQLAPGKGLVTPEVGLSRRRSDRATGLRNRLLLVELGDEPTPDIEAWAQGLFTTEVARDPLAAVESLQTGPGFGCVLIVTSRRRVGDTVRTCRAMRPLTGAPILVASDDAMRSTDRVDILEAGADDCLSGGVDVRELATRIRQAAETGGKPPPRRGEPAPKRDRPVGGPVDRATFRGELDKRLGDPFLSILNVVRVVRPGGSESELRDCLIDEIRGEQGDLVLSDRDGFLVLLQDARRDAARAFVERVRRRLAAGPTPDAALRTEVYSHPGDRRGLSTLFPDEAPVGAERPEAGPGAGSATSD